MDNEQHFLKGGVSLKYLQGLTNAYAFGQDVTIDYDADGNPSGLLSQGEITTTGTVTYGTNSSDDFDDFSVAQNASGFASDLGLIYEWRPDFVDYQVTNDDGETVWDRNANKYKLKFGLSLTDMGSINFEEGTQTRYNINGSISEEDYEDAEDVEAALDQYYEGISESSAEKSVLPAALHLNADWNINNRFYVNLNSDLAMTSKKKANVNRITNVLSLTPRFERKWFSFYLPLSVVQHTGFQMGAGFRAGPLYLGSGSMVSLLTSDNVQAADIYFGLKVPIYQRKNKNRKNSEAL